MNDPAPTSSNPSPPVPEPSASPVEVEVITAPAPLVSQDGNELRAARIVNNHVLWALGAGLIPVPIADLAAVTAIQMDALQQLAKLYGIEYSSDHGKRFVAALTGGAAARVGASFIKAIPGVGTVLGGLSMSALSAASTYAVCQVALHHFREHRDFLTVNLDWARDAYEKMLVKGRELVKKLQEGDSARRAKEVAESLKELKSLRAKDVLTEDEYAAKKSALLERLD